MHMSVETDQEGSDGLGQFCFFVVHNVVVRKTEPTEPNEQ